jgi:hypothetical protein
MGDQCAECAYRWRGNPHRRHTVACQQLGHLDRVARIGLDRSGDFGLDFGRIGHNHTRHQRCQPVVEFPGIGGRFEHDLVGGSQVALCPGLKLGEQYLAWSQHHRLVRRHRPNHHVGFVDIERNEALIRVGQRLLLLSSASRSRGTIGRVVTGQTCVAYTDSRLAQMAIACEWILAGAPNKNTSLTTGDHLIYGSGWPDATRPCDVSAQFTELSRGYQTTRPIATRGLGSNRVSSY